MGILLGLLTALTWAAPIFSRDLPPVASERFARCFTCRASALSCSRFLAVARRMGTSHGRIRLAPGAAPASGDRARDQYLTEGSPYSQTPRAGRIDQIWQGPLQSCEATRLREPRRSRPLGASEGSAGHRDRNRRSNRTPYGCTYAPNCFNLVSPCGGLPLTGLVV